MKLHYLLRKEIYEGKKSLLIYSITILLVLFFQEMLGSIVTTWNGGLNITSWYESNFPGFLFLGGFILTSVFFSTDMFNKSGQHNWLMLPASSGEKFLAKALITSIGYPLALTTLFFVSSAVIETLAKLTTGDNMFLFNPFTKDMGWMLLHYVVTQSVFLLGATFFRKAHFVKTVLSLGLIALAASLVAGLFARIVFAPYFTGLFQIVDVHFEAMMDISEGWLKTYSVLGQTIYWALLAPFCWAVAYLRVKEVQSTDAIQ